MAFGDVGLNQKKEISAGLGGLVLIGVLGAAFSAMYWSTVTSAYDLFSMPSIGTPS